MSDPNGSDTPGGHGAAVKAFLALVPEERYQRLVVPYGEPEHVADEVVTAVTRRATRERWPDVDRYAGQMMQRVYRHVNSHVGKNRGWVSLAGGMKVARDDFSGHVLLALSAEQAEVCHAEIAFGDYVYKRCLDYADSLYAKKNSAGQSLTDQTEADAIEHGAEANSSVSTPSPEKWFIEQEEDVARDVLHERIRELVQQDGFLTEKERTAFTFYYFGALQIDSKDESELTVRRLMGCSEASVRIYIRKAKAKIKEKLK